MSFFQEVFESYCEFLQRVSFSGERYHKWSGKERSSLLRGCWPLLLWDAWRPDRGRGLFKNSWFRDYGLNQRHS